MANKRDREAKRRKDQQQWQQENESLKAFKSKGHLVKSHLRNKGIVIPFYDYLDSYPDEFNKIAEFAKQTYPSLMGVHEVEPAIYDSIENHFADFGYGELDQVFFGLDSQYSDYGSASESNLTGITICFKDGEQQTRNAIFINQAVKGGAKHVELKYAYKIGVLCHEIGHVHDIEHAINFNVDKNEFDLLEAEIFANLYALNLMGERNLKASYSTFIEIFNSYIGRDGYMGKVAAGVLERNPGHTFVDWQELINS